MKIAPGNSINLAPAQPGWTVTVTYSGEHPSSKTYPVIGWATVVGAHLNDGTTTTVIEPAFAFEDTGIFTESELRDHNPEPFLLTLVAPEGIPACV